MIVCNLYFVAIIILSINTDVFVRCDMVEGNLIVFWVFFVIHGSGRIVVRRFDGSFGVCVFLLDKGSIVGGQVDFSFLCPALSRRGL